MHIARVWPLWRERARGVRVGEVLRFTGTTVLKVENGLITEEVGLDDGVTALQQLGLIPEA